MTIKVRLGLVDDIKESIACLRVVRYFPKRVSRHTLLYHICKVSKVGTLRFEERPEGMKDSPQRSVL